MIRRDINEPTGQEKPKKQIPKFAQASGDFNSWPFAQAAGTLPLDHLGTDVIEESCVLII